MGRKGKEYKMKTFNIENENYKLEFSFDAAEIGGLVQKMFNMLTGQAMIKHQTEENELAALLSGTGEMVSEYASICRLGFYAGLLEHHDLSEEESKVLMKKYMKKKKYSYMDLYKELVDCMEKDGFFDLTGLNQAITEMSTIADSMEQTEEEEFPLNPPEEKK